MTTAITRTNRGAQMRAALAFVVALLLTLGLAATARAASGDLDPTFSGDGRQTTDFFGGSDSTGGAARQPDGKVVVAGSAAQGSNGRFAAARYNLDGSLDPSFSGDGRQTVDFGVREDSAYGVVLQPDGKIVMAGTASVGGRAVFAVARLNANGSVDRTFSGDGKAITRMDQSWIGSAVALDSDGRIVVTGYTFGSDGFAAYVAVARFLPNGSLDPSFSGDGRQTTDFGSDRENYASDVAVDRAGKVVLVGQLSGGDFQPEASFFGVARLNEDGTPDPTFSGDGKQQTGFRGEDGAADVLLQPDGRIVAAGSTVESSGPEADEYKDFALARYRTNGSLDPTFSGDGVQVTDLGASDGISGAALASDGKLVAAGTRFSGGNAFDFALARYAPSGALDRSFSGDGRLTTDFAGSSDFGAAVVLPPSGKILVAGSATRSSSDFGLARYRG